MGVPIRKSQAGIESLHRHLSADVAEKAKRLLKFKCFYSRGRGEELYGRDAGKSSHSKIIGRHKKYTIPAEFLSGDPV